MNEKSLKGINDLKRNYFFSGPVILKAEDIFKDYFNVEKRTGCKLFFYKNNVYLLDEINMRVHKYEKGPGVNKEIFKPGKSENLQGMTAWWNLGENNPRYLLVLSGGTREFILLNLENDEIEDEFTLDFDGNVPGHKFAVHDRTLYIGLSDTLFIKRVGEDRLIDKISLPMVTKGSLLNNIYSAGEEIFLTSFHKESKAFGVYRLTNGTFDNAAEIFPSISNFDIDKKGDIFCYSSFDQTIRKFDADWNPVFRHRLDTANKDYRGMVVIDKYLYLTVTYCSNIRVILKYDISMNVQPFSQT